MNDAIGFAGFVTAMAGVAFVHWPSALIIGGFMMIAAAVMRSNKGGE